MKQLILIVSILCICLVISGCSNDEEVEQPHAQPTTLSPINMTEPVTIGAEASVTTDGRFLVKGTTNLPQQSKLLVSITNETNGFMAQDSSEVLSGVFSAGPFGPKSGLTSGNYIVEVSMSSSSDQLASVQMAIGNEGQYLYGPLVQESDWGGKIVEYSFPYAVGSQQSIDQAESIHRNLVTDIKNTVNDLLTTGRLMEQYRNTEDLSALRTCGNMMRENQSLAKQVRAKAETLPLKYIELKAATIDVNFCVSCSNTALESCERVAKALKNNE